MDEQQSTPEREQDDRSAPILPTGVSQVDDAVARLDELAGSPLSEHVERYDAVHAALQDSLAGLDRD